MHDAYLSEHRLQDEDDVDDDATSVIYMHMYRAFQSEKSKIHCPMRQTHGVKITRYTRINEVEEGDPLGGASVSNFCTKNRLARRQWGERSDDDFDSRSVLENFPKERERERESHSGLFVMRYEKALFFSVTLHCLVMMVTAFSDNRK